MKLDLSSVIRVSLAILGSVLAGGKVALSQVTPDNTNINTQVNQNGSVAEITGGQTRGSNLFHSFQDFSVPTGNEASFNNANDISNIFSRVTGGNISNIDGAIRANGSASLFLINPAGIIFGENASLDLGGSFYGSSASSIVFEDGEFSAADLENQPILTVNAPIGLSFRNEPGDIVNRSTAQSSIFEDVAGLEVSPRNSLALIGGNIDFETGNVTARSGNINLGGLSQAGIVEIDRDGSFSFPEDVAKADISLNNGADVDVQGIGGGNITVEAQNLTLESGEFGSSVIRGGIIAQSTNPEIKAGDITINVTGNIAIDDGGIANQVNRDAIGNSGNITISTTNLNLTDGGNVNVSTLGTGNAGAVNVTATGDITADGETSQGSPSGIASQVNPDAEGDSGEVTISTTNLNLTNGGSVDASTGGTGNAGAVNVTATENITADGENSQGFQSGIASSVNPDAEGDSGGVTISTTNLNLTNGGIVIASTLDTGNAGAVNVTATGDIAADGENSQGFQSGIASSVNPDAEGDSGGVTISTTNLNLTNGGIVDASTLGTGNAGAVNVTATGDIAADGQNSQGFQSSITSQVNPDAEGDSGGVTISTTNLNLTNGGIVSASTLGTGNAGAVNVTATGNITVDGSDSEGVFSGINSGVNLDAEGDSGGVTISTTNLNLTNGGNVNASTFGQGNAGDVNVNALESIFISGIEDFRVGISANAIIENGNGGNVNVSTDRLIIQNNGIVEASNRDFQNVFASGTGLPGNISIKANTIELNDGAIGAATQSTEGVRGNIDLEVAESIVLENNSFISAEAFGEANGGNLSIDTNFVIAFSDNNDIIASAEQGQGGDININAESLLGIEERPLSDSTNDINASSEFSLDGNITISTPDVNPVQGATELSTNIVVPEETTTQACRANRQTAAKSGLNITGKGGILAPPDLPLDSLNVSVDNQGNSSTMPKAVSTSAGKIQPARGIKVNESGEVILTAYRTNNSGERLPEIKRNCGS